MRYLVFVLLSIWSLNLNSQVLDEEIGFRLVKAEYLFTTERFEDAIKELNEIIKQNPTFKNALLLRAETKYKLAAYKGAKQDAMESINSNGVTSKACAILGKSDFAMNMEDAAFNSLSAAIALGEKDVKVYELRAQIYENRNQKISACEDWQAAARLGSTTGAINAKKNCGVSNPTKQDPAPQTTPQTNPTHADDSDVVHTQPADNTNTTIEVKDSTKLGDNEVLSDGTPSNDSTKVETANGNETSESTELLPEEDNTVNEVYIDEDLTLEIFGQGLGKRRIMEKPSILILAEKDGIVTVEICVNNEGRVDFAEFVPSKSTINQNSLVSLAIRKAKEFWFEESDYPKQCGFIRFKIKGS